jgi:hypothetical protein
MIERREASLGAETGRSNNATEKIYRAVSIQGRLNALTHQREFRHSQYSFALPHCCRKGEQPLRCEIVNAMFVAERLLMQP